MSNCGFQRAELHTLGLALSSCKDFWRWSVGEILTRATGYYEEFVRVEDVARNDREFSKPDGFDNPPIIFLYCCPAQATRPGGAQRLFHLVIEVLGKQYVGNRYTAAGLQDAERLAIDGGLVRAEVDDTVRDHGIGKTLGKSRALDRADHQLNIRPFEFCLHYRLLSLLYHLRREVDPDDPATRPDLTCGEYHVDARSATKVDDDLAFPEVRIRDGIAATSGEVNRCSWKGAELILAVKALLNRDARTGLLFARSAGPLVNAGLREPVIPVADRLLYFFITHQGLRFAIRVRSLSIINAYGIFKSTIQQKPSVGRLTNAYKSACQRLRR